MDGQTLEVDSRARVPRRGLAACAGGLYPDGRAGGGASRTLNRGHRRTGRALDARAAGPCAPALRGVDLVTAVVLAAEIGNFKRFRTPKQLMAYLGLVPSEHSSGGADGREGLPARAIAMHAGCWWKPLGTIAFVRAARDFTRVDNGWRPAWRHCRTSGAALVAPL